MWEREFQQPPVLASFPLEFPGRPSCLLAMCSGPTKHISVSFTGQKEKKVNIKTKTQKGRYENRRPKNTRTTNSERALKLHKLVDPQVEIACNLFGSQISSSKPKNLLDHKNVLVSTFFLAWVCEYILSSLFPAEFSPPIVLLLSHNVCMSCERGTGFPLAGYFIFCFMFSIVSAGDASEPKTAFPCISRLFSHRFENSWHQL